MDAAVGDWSAAQSDYEQALSQDANLTEVFVPLARALWQQGAYREAWDRLERARIAIPWDPEIPLLLAAWEGQRPEITAGGEERAAARRAAATPPRVAIAPEAHEEVPILRVGLVENLRSVFLKTGGPFTVEEVDSGTIVFEDNLSRGAVMHAVTSPGGVTLAVEGIGEVYRGSSAVRLGHHDRSYTTTIFDLTYGHGQFSAGREDRSYRGEIELLPRNGTITVVTASRWKSISTASFHRKCPRGGPKKPLPPRRSRRGRTRSIRATALPTRVRPAQLGSVGVLPRRHQRAPADDRRDRRHPGTRSAGRRSPSRRGLQRQ
jgi:hypothetical protein